MILPDINSLAMTKSGRGRHALFVHGFGGSKFIWRQILAGSEDFLSAIAVDLPGSGLSKAPIGFDYSLESFAKVIKRLILQHDLTDVLLVAHSYGASVALLTALDHDQSFTRRISAICVVDGIAYPQQLPFFVSTLRVPILGEAIIEFLPARLQVKMVLNRCYFDKKRITDDQINEYAGHLARSEVRAALLKTARKINLAQAEQYPPCEVLPQTF